MSKIKFTPQQERAISGKGDALLVSAAAGSGKTAVLVERILRYLTEEQGDIRRLMITTYTRPAAEELRQKIKRAVDTRLREQGGGDHLLRQSTLIDSAEIGTVHSICLGLITRHFQQLDLDPRCRLIDDTAEQAMVEEEAEQFLEELYGKEDAAVQTLLQSFANARSDENVKALLIRGLHFLENQPLPQDYIRRALEPYGNIEQGLFACFREDGLYRYITQNLEELQAQYTFLAERAARHPYLSGFPQLLAFLEEERQSLSLLPRLLEKRDYDAFVQGLQNFKFATLNWKKLTESDGDKDAQDMLTNERKRFKKAFKEFGDRFAQTEAEELAQLHAEGNLLETYFTLCMTLRERLAAARRRGGWISYQDMEHMAVRLLVQDYDPDTDVLTPTPLALQLRGDYDEIIIDEFQDTNRSQDLIFRALSQEEKNLFMVGDLKQSIYRFRGAEPEIFDQKRQHSAPFAGERLQGKTVLELNANFRSHPGVLRFANRVFESIMSPELGGVRYDEREKLIPGRVFGEPDAPRAELHWLIPESDPITGKKIDVAEQNARYTARLIAKAVAERQPVLLPDGATRPVEYRDFAILLHTVAGTAPVFEQELQRLGIPVVNHNVGSRFFELFEVQSILSYLLVLNNPYDDVALVSLLYGDYFRFTVGELAAMRHRHAPLYDDLRRAAETCNKARKAYEQIENYRQLAGSLYVYDLLYRIYQESSVFAAYAAEEGGAEKCANLELLAEDARLFEQEGYRGLYAFVQHIRITRSGSQGGARLKAAENSVQIMSIHKSKGLEFPVCILGDCHKKFNRSDLNERILLHSRWGAAAEYSRPELYFRCRSLAQTVLADQMTADSVGEEERVLYVALTRPISKTVVLMNAAEKKVEQWAAMGASLGNTLPQWLIKGSDASFGRWLTVLMAGSKEGAALRQRFGLPEQEYPALGAAWIVPTAQEEAVKVEQEEAQTAAFDRDAFRTRLDWQYPHLSAVRLPAKLSVSELKGIREQDAEAQPLLEERLKKAEPRFVSNFRPRGNEVGNALHQALQFSNFEQLQKDPAEELLRLVNEGFILEEQRQMIPLEKIRRFTQSPCFLQLLGAESYSKEERFLFPMPANQLFGADAEGEILIQGVLDCYSVQGKDAMILDYKTDRVSSPKELADRYRVQMDLYEEALKRVKGLRVTRRVIYSFSLEQEIEL